MRKEEGVVSFAFSQCAFLSGVSSEMCCQQTLLSSEPALSSLFVSKQKLSGGWRQ